MPDDAPEPIEIESAWIGADDLPVHFANAFAGIVGPNAIFLTIGSQVPPAVESDEDLAQLLAAGYLPITPIARFAVTPAGLDEMIRSLEETRNNYQNLLSAIKIQEEGK